MSGWRAPASTGVRSTRVLEGHFELIVGNARHIRNVPGRKTDVKDAEWIAELVRHGLIAKSFVPPPPLRELRDLLRYRRKLVESQAAERNRLLKLLETANIKLASVASDVFGVSGQAMLKALIESNASAEEMAGLAKGKLRQKHDDLVLALEGRFEEHHRFLLSLQLRRLEAAEQDIQALDLRIAERLEPYSLQHTLLTQIPGVDWVVAAVLIAEIGVDMSVFLSVHHLAAWAGVCPGNHESAGKQKSGRSRKGNVQDSHHVAPRLGRLHPPHDRQPCIQLGQDAVQVSGVAACGFLADGVRVPGAQARLGALGDQCALELGDGTQHLQREHALWRGGVDRVAQAAEMRALGFELLDDVEQMADRPGEAIEPDHDEGLAGSDLAQQARQYRAGAISAGGVLLADRIAAGGAQLVELRIGVLLLG